MSNPERSILLAGGSAALVPRLEDALQATGRSAVIRLCSAPGAALERLAVERYDVLFVDAADLNGGFPGLAATVRQRGIDAPAMIVTGVESDAAGAALVRDGAGDYLLADDRDPAHLARIIRHQFECRCLASAVFLGEARYQRLLESVTDYTYTVIIEHGRAAASRHGPGCSSVTGYASEEYEQDPFLWLRMVHDEDRPTVLEMSSQILEGRFPPPLEHRIFHRDGSIRWIRNTPVLHFDREGRLVSYDGLVSDITRLKQAEQRLTHVSYYDSLTDLPNRELLRDRLRQALVRARRHGRMLAVMALDLDRFKGVNETLGHVTGDRLLESVAERLVRCVREDDTVARPGGDEFLMLFADMAGPRDASIIAQKVQDAFAQGFSAGGQEYFITASLGISLYPDHGEDADTLIGNADAALSQAKAEGRNTYQFYHEARHAGTRRKLLLENSLRKAIDREEFTVHYQPMVDLASGRTTGVEALVRWQHPEQGLLPPLEFIPLAEESGLIIPLGEWILLHACRQARQWCDAGLPPLRMSVNLSMRQFTQNAVTDMVMNAINASKLDPGLLELELTESMVMNNAEATIASLRELRSIGVRLSLDDFGTGYSSLSRLKDLPLSALKLDRSFVSTITRDPSNAAISRAIICLSHNLGLRVVAEGVETTEQLEFLRGLDCDEVQGYLFSRPVPARDLLPFMDSAPAWPPLPAPWSGLRAAEAPRAVLLREPLMGGREQERNGLTAGHGPG